MKNLNLLLLGLSILSLSFLSACSSEEGCTNPDAMNYNADAEDDDGSCIVLRGCTDPEALNYDPEAREDNGTCIHNPTTSHRLIVARGEWDEKRYLGFSATKELEAITQNVLNEGAVLVYMLDQGLQRQLPYTKYIPKVDPGTEYWSYELDRVGEISFWVDIEGMPYFDFGRVEFRVVIIENMALIENLEINLENYDEVSSSFNFE